MDTILREKVEKAKNEKSVRVLSWLNDKEYSGIIKSGSEISVDAYPDTLYFLFEISSSEDFNISDVVFPDGTFFKVGNEYHLKVDPSLDKVLVAYPLPSEDPAYGKKKVSSKTEEKIPQVIKDLAEMNVVFP